MKKCNVMRHIKPIIVLLILFFGFVGKVEALKFMYGNESCIAFPRSCIGGGGLVSGTSISIGSLIIEGGYNFFNSDSNMSLFVSLVEISELNGTDFKAMQTALNAAIDNMEKAKATYYQLKELAAGTPYNQDVILQLMKFDYVKYQYENGLIPVIFERVKKYLSVGDVRGVYNEFYSNTLQLLDGLYSVKKDIDSNVLPGLPTLWRLSQKYSEVKLFGQYVAEVFIKIERGV